MSTPRKPSEKAPKTPSKKASKPRAKARADSPSVSPRVARRERRRERSREEIVDAARRVLLRNGLAATTTDAVADELGLTRAALYYYFPSKDALFFEVMFGVLDAQTKAVHDAVEQAKTGAEALRAIIGETVRSFEQLDDFRLAILQTQLVKPGAVRFTPEQFARLRPLNDRSVSGATKLLAAESKDTPGRAGIDPRLMAFLAMTSAVGLLTMKGLVESLGDPLRYSDEQLVDALSQIFAAAASQ